MYGFYSWQKYFLDLLGQRPGLGHRRDRRPRRAHADPRQRPGRADHGARPATAASSSWCARGVTTVAVIGAALVQQFWVAVPLYLVSTHRLRHLHAGQAGMAQRAHPVGAARDDHLAGRAVRRRRARRWARSASAGSRRRSRSRSRGWSAAWCRASASRCSAWRGGRSGRSPRTPPRGAAGEPGLEVESTGLLRPGAGVTCVPGRRRRRPAAEPPGASPEPPLRTREPAARSAPPPPPASCSCRRAGSSS